MFQWTLVKRFVGIAAIVLGLMFFGMKGLLAGVVINNYFAYVVNISLVSKYIGYRWSSQLKDILPVVVVSIVAALASYFSGTLFHIGLYIGGVLKTLVYIVIYLGWSLIFKPKSFEYTLSIVPERFQFWNRKNRK